MVAYSLHSTEEVTAGKKPITVSELAKDIGAFQND